MKSPVRSGPTVSTQAAEVFCWEGIAGTWVSPMKVELKKKKKNPVGKLFLVFCLPRKCQESSSTGSCVGQGPRTQAHPQRVINTFLVHSAACSSWLMLAALIKQQQGWGRRGQWPAQPHTEARGTGWWLSLLPLALSLGCDAVTGSHRSWSYRKKMEVKVGVTAA